VEKWTLQDERMKIIGEILEFYNELQQYRKVASPRIYEKLCIELADIVISTCTMLKMQDRSYRQYPESYEQDPEEWIKLVLGRRFDKLITNAEEYARMFSIDIESAISRKLAYNRTRKDWIKE
jgi:NTP pyrophosphatase (non-canonical NTP hydrolase)